jgi:hypothetical protein
MIDFSPIDRMIEDSFEELAQEFAITQIEQLESEKWDWPRQTVRSDGSVADSPRDIIDTGALRDSLYLEWISPLECVYHYDANYAIFVHEGARLQNGTELPARQWVWGALEEYDLVDNFARILQEKIL